MAESNENVAPPQRVALVTGAAKGIGLGIAQALAQRGHKVAITYRSTTPDPAATDGLMAVQCDVTDADQIDAAFSEIEEALGPIDIVVSNAGITRDGLLLRMSEDDFTSVIDANLTSGYRLAKRATKPMMKARWGRIVLIGSVVGLAGQAGQANYAASKAGLVGLARSLAREFGSRNITVNVVAPGPIETDMLNELSDTQRAAIIDVVPVGRVGQVNEVAAAVAFLASEDAGYITGAVVPVDGGLGMGS